MKPDISEFSYGYAVTEELVHCLPGITAAPVFPSLYQEGQVGGGYDLMLQFGEIPLFVQFKLSDYMTRRSAQECQKAILDTPFYRMSLRPSRHSKQHELLLRWEQQGHDVYYAAPGFHTTIDLNSAYLSKTVVGNSVWIRPMAIGPLPDGKDHHVSFKTLDVGYFCSDPVLIQESIDALSMRSRLISSIRDSQKSRETADDQVDTMVRSLLEISKQELGLFDRLLIDEQISMSRETPLQRLAHLARRVLDVQLYKVSLDEP